jgi:hypothetical protein
MFGANYPGQIYPAQNYPLYEFTGTSTNTAAPGTSTAVGIIPGASSAGGFFLGRQFRRVRKPPAIQGHGRSRATPGRSNAFGLVILTGSARAYAGHALAVAAGRLEFSGRAMAKPSVRPRVDGSGVHRFPDDEQALLTLFSLIE